MMGSIEVKKNVLEEEKCDVSKLSDVLFASYRVHVAKKGDVCQKEKTKWRVRRRKKTSDVSEEKKWSDKKKKSDASKKMM